MDPELDRSVVLNRRAMILAGGQLALFAVLGARMYQLQIMNADQYRMMADENRVDLRLISPMRGRIYDRNMVELATNRLSYRILVIAEQTQNLGETLTSLGKIVPLRDGTIDRVRKEARRTRSFLPITVAENLSWEDFARVNARLTDLPGIYPDAGQTRYYPYPHVFSSLVGYVAPVTDRELEDLPEDPVFLLPEFRTGKSGIEKVSDNYLRGSAGSRKVEVNAVGREIRELSRQEGTQGGDVHLTVDHRVQQFIVDRLGEESAGVVAMNVHSGEVLAVVSTPGFDANEFNFGISRTKYRQLQADPRKPFFNKAVSGAFPPGSTFKMIVALAAIEAGIVDPASRVFCSGKTPFGDRVFHCWKRGGHGRVNLVEAIEQSCDTYFYELAKKLDIEDIAEMARRFGLGQRYGIEIGEEAAGNVPTRDWKLKRTGARWQKGDTLNASIGQGDVLATPLQLAVMTARIANGGKEVVPTLIKSSPDEAARGLGASGKKLGISSRSLRLVQQGMADVLEGPRGTAKASRLRVGPYRMAGKTGTAQARGISIAEREGGLQKNEEKPWQERDHSLFVAYAPVDDPLYSVAVVVQHGGSGSAVAAPIARDIMAELLRTDPEGKLAADEGGHQRGKTGG